MRTRTALTAAALATAVTLTLTACGDSDSGDDGGTEQIEGAKDSSPDASASPTQEEAPEGAPDVSLPEDIKLVFDWEEPSKPEHAAAQRDAANYIRSQFRGSAEQELNEPSTQFYARDQALTYAQDQIQQDIDAQQSATGTERFYRVETKSYGRTVGISFCADQTKIYSKKLKTGEVLRTEPSDADFLFYQITMSTFPGRDEVWQATGIDVEGEAVQCKE
ncbi:hypothetical protein [Streptomyces sp. CMB-StM0423]|uniref:hypothetical protein n=1 Tax=Streptomyces sp. CMB-StM0423 TaxID=2059884 RepID=UPI000C710CAD|nr:hypothetical protein [Streptomyces sp. CMB-StM0423]AUH40397.1 hypothetical protein CXR04_09160 [Streptomyces sp. CMB-StM0423]